MRLSHDALGQTFPPRGGPRRLAILGSTGSIGSQALDVAAWHGHEVVALAAGRNAALLLEQVRRFRPRLVSVAAEIVGEVAAALPSGTQLVAGEAGTIAVATADVDTVVAAIPGFAGLAPVRAALSAGRHVALANKEAMVCAGALMWSEAERHGARLTPVDSEHAALYQALLGEPLEALDALVLTASGGPFRTGPVDLSQVTPEQALAHPTWRMGAKVTIDSATLFNKGLEVLEAAFLFRVPLDRIEVVVHPQSLVHGLVRLRDGSIKAQIGPHDMRLPIAYAIAAPDRPSVPLEPLPLIGTWTFEAPDTNRFPALALAYAAGRAGGDAPVRLNAADEVAVAAFLSGELRFDAIPMVLEQTIAGAQTTAPGWDDLAEIDAEARRIAREAVAAIGS